MFDLPTAQPAHPARYTDALLLTMAQMLQGSTRILDPFGGTGKVFLLNAWLPAAQIEAVEIEPEWAEKHPRTTLGNALALPWEDDYFDAVCTSPTYGNRMADHHNAADASARRTYTHTLGRTLHPDNAGAMDWGDRYRTFHVAAWTEARRVLSVGGRFVLNIKDHIRAGERQHVTAWHVDTLMALGFAELRHERINTPSHRYGANSEARMEYESIILFELKAKGL
jgi:tRNA G10  N-methylase Trm11